MIRFLKKKLLFNSSRYRLNEENKSFAEDIPNDSIVLDAGAGEQFYKYLLDHTQYEAADFEKVDKEYAKSTYVCDLSNIPVEDERFDYVLFNQVMEHLSDPMKALNELNRVLKPNGKIIYTGPLFYEEHEIPYDFFRYTQFSLKKMFYDSGFEIERLDWMEGYFGTVGYQLNRMAAYLPFKPKDIHHGIMGYLLFPILLFTKIFSGLFSIFFHQLEVKIKYTKKGYPKNYVAIIRKK